jgi:hypothetical protein
MKRLRKSRLSQRDLAELGLTRDFVRRRRIAPKKIRDDSTRKERQT